ncbi:MAG: DEAD/DEAH box helicase [Archaeoglobaceae archaeon]
MEVKQKRSKALLVGSPEEYKELIKRLTLHAQSQLNRDIVIEVRGYELTPEGLYIPRGLVDCPIEDANWDRVEIPFRFTLREYQEKAIQQFYRYDGNCIFSAPTGAGKTVMALALASQIGYRTLVVVHTDALFNQWIEKIQEITGLKERHIGYIRGSDCVIDRPIVVGMLKTLALGKYVDRERLYKHFGFTIYDEVHRVPTEKFNVVAGMFWDRYRLGLSGTVERKDKLHQLVKWHIGRSVEVSLDYKVEPTVYSIYVSFPMRTEFLYNRRGDFQLPRFLNMLCDLKLRTFFICALIAYAYRKRKQIIVFSDRLNLLEEIAKILKKKISPSEIGFITGQKKTINEKVRVYLSTYGSAGEGVDIPALDCVIFATPRADVRQAVGRILRPVAGKKPVVFDIVDTTVTEARVMHKSRLKRVYKERNWVCKDWFVSGEELLNFIRREGFYE